MARTKHGQSWIARHLNDTYVKQAQQQGYRSRASFKLLELQEKNRLFRQGMVVVDLGAAPGGWSQVVAPIVGETGKVVALDRLSMAPIPGVIVLEADFDESNSLDLLKEALDERPVNWVLSDMAPNISGITSSDQPRMMGLAELALDFAKQHLKQGGGFLVKIFQGEGFEAFHRDLRKSFKKVSIKKPSASRSASREVYVLAEGYYNI